MTEKERLVQLINQVRGEEIALADYEAEILADYLLANGVIVPPCKVGDYVLWDSGLKDSKPKMLEVKGFYYNSADLGLRYILEGCQPIINFSSIVGIVPKEDAEEELKKRGKENEC